MSENKQPSADEVMAEELLLVAIKQYNQDVSDIYKFSLNSTEFKMFGDVIREYATIKTKALQEQNAKLIEALENLKRLAEIMEYRNTLEFIDKLLKEHKK